MNPKGKAVAANDGYQSSNAHNTTLDSQADYSNPTTWGEPILFAEHQPPDISTTVLPGWLGEYAQAVCKHTQTPGGLAVMLSLSMVATCLQRKIEIRPYGDRDNYQEPVNIWTITALPPASRKTAVISALTFPLVTWEKEQAQQITSEQAELETRRQVDEARISELQRKAAKENEADKREELIKAITKIKAAMPEAVRAPRLWTQDATPERLQDLLVENGETMAVLSDEGGIFEVMAGLYNDGRANIDVFLQAHAGSPARVDRGSRQAHLNRPALTFGLAVQPQVILDLGSGSKKRFRGLGALARFLYCFPPSNIGRRDMRKREPIPDSVKEAYSQGIGQLLLIEPRVQGDEKLALALQLEAAALEKWEQFAGWIEQQHRAGGPLEGLQDWTGKLPGAALRIAGLLHVAEHGVSTLVVSQSTIERALDLCAQLIAHAQFAFDVMADDPALADARYALDWIRKNAIGLDTGSYVIRQNDLHKTGRFKNSKLERLTKALDLLRERNILSGQFKSPSNGRPACIWFVNPMILAEVEV